jgi:hypothetical protein
LIKPTDERSPLPAALVHRSEKLNFVTGITKPPTTLCNHSNGAVCIQRGWLEAVPMNSSMKALAGCWQFDRMKWIKLTLPVGALLLSLCSSSSHADEASMRTIEAAVTGHMCPADTSPYARLRCDTECDSDIACTPPKKCWGPTQDNDCLNRFNQCVARMNEVNAKIDAYNSTCGSRSNKAKSPAPASSGAPANRPQEKPAQTELQRLKEEAQEKAKNAPAINQQHLQEINQAAERYRQEAAQKAADEAKKQAQRSKWHCWGEVGNVAEGFRECRQACAEFYGAGFCYSQCHDSGDASFANGRSCFQEP